MTKSTTDHVFFDSTDGEVRCRHCEDKTALADGSTAELLVMRLRGFLLMHKLCQPKAVASPQLALPGTEMPAALRREIDAAEIAADGGDGHVQESNVATCWVDLWPQLEKALAPHEYQALVEWTPFVALVDLMDAPGEYRFEHLASWSWRESLGDPLPPEPRPKWFQDAVYEAVKAAQERHAAAGKEAAKPRKKRARKAPAASITER